jgi:hypothetical protein
MGVAVLPTPGRMMAAQGLPINQAATVTSQAVAWLLQLRYEQEGDRWVAARSLIDIYVYATLAAERTATILERALLAELEAATKTLLAQSRYDLLVYLPPVLALQADDVRDPDPRFQAAVDAGIRLLLGEWELEHLVLDPHAPDAVEQVLLRLGSHQVWAPEKPEC